MYGPVRSFAVFLGSCAVLCSPLWSFAVFSITGFCVLKVDIMLRTSLCELQKGMLVVLVMGII